MLYCIIVRLFVCRIEVQTTQRINNIQYAEDGIIVHDSAEGIVRMVLQTYTTY